MSWFPLMTLKRLCPTRLYTHGYDCFAPAETVVYHHYSRAHRRTLQQDAGAADQELVGREKRASIEAVQCLLELATPRTLPGSTFKGSASPPQDTREHRLRETNRLHYGLGK